MVQDPVNRSENIDTLYRMVAAITPRWTTEEWLARLSGRDIPCARVNSIDDLLSEPHLTDIGFFSVIDHPTEGRLRSVHTPFRNVVEPDLTDLPPPNLGADGRAILTELGFGDSRIDELVAAGAVRLQAEP